MSDYSFVTDRLAIGDVASRATPGFEQYGAPVVPEGVPVHMIDLRDGEKGLETHLDGAVAFIAEHITKGCVLVHCGAGLSRSVSVVAAYLCRYAGMSLSEAVNFIKAKRQGACPADIFWAAITHVAVVSLLATAPAMETRGAGSRRPIRRAATQEQPRRRLAVAQAIKNPP